jgi:hypothetical protein
MSAKQMSAEEMVVAYGQEVGLSWISIEQLIESHRRQREHIQTLQARTKADLYKIRREVAEEERVHVETEGIARYAQKLMGMSLADVVNILREDASD